MAGSAHTFGDGNRAAALAAIRQRGGVLITSYGMVLHNAEAVRAAHR